MISVSLALVLCAAELPKLAVLDLQAPGVDASTVLAVQEAVTANASKRGFFQVISSTEIRTMLGVERQKQLLGCSEGTSCQAELADALGSRFALSGSLTMLGDALQLSLQMIDTQKAQPVGRSTRIAPNAKSLISVMPWIVAEATATPAPPTPSRALPITLLGVGIASVIAGGVLGFAALTQDATLTAELNLSSPPKLLSDYRSDAARIRLLGTVSLISLGVGAALIVLGAVLFPTDPQQTVALVPTSNGFALAGVLP